MVGYWRRRIVTGYCGGVVKIKILSFARITQRKKTLRNINCIHYVTGCVQLNRVHCSSICIHTILHQCHSVYTNLCHRYHTSAVSRVPLNSTVRDFVCTLESRGSVLAMSLISDLLFIYISIAWRSITM